MKKILVLVLALLCVFSVAAMAETEAFQPEFGTHHFYANTVEAKAMEDYKGHTATTYSGWYNQVGTLVNTPNYLAIFGSTEATCTQGATYTFKCADENCTDADRLVTITVSEPQHTNLVAVENDPRNKAAKCDEMGVQVYNCDVCGEVVVDVPTIPHSYEGPEAAVVTAPTCTEDGYITYNCDFCDESHTEKTADATKHDFKYEFVLVEPATCLKAGKAAWLHVCQNDGCNATMEGEESYYFTLPVISHFEADLDGYNAISDVKQKVILDARFAEAFDFVMEDGEYVQNAEGLYYVENVDVEAAKALLTGEKIEVVVGAGDDGVFGTNDDKTEKVQLHGDYTFTYTAPKCEIEGTLVITCKNCSASVTYAIEALEHKYVVKAVNDVENWDDADLDCTKGYKVYVECELCDDYFQQNTVVCDKHDITAASLEQKLYNNTYNSVEKFDIEKLDEMVEENMAPCLPYTVTYYCDCQFKTVDGFVLEGVTCGYEYEEVEAKTEEHHIDWGSDKVYKYVAATCKTPGYVLYTCDVCFTPDRFDYAVDADAHDFENIEWTTTPAKCEEDGLKTGVCPICQETLEVVIPMTGHDWDKESKDYTEWNETPATCTVDGEYYRTCKTCKEKESVTIKAGHTYKTNKAGEPIEYVSYTAPTCTTYGEISYYCTVCHAPVANQQIPMLKHEMKPVATVANATCCVGTQKIYACDNCSAKEVREENDALGHKDLTAAEIAEIKKVIKAGTDEYTHVYYTKHATCETAGEGYKLCASLIQVYAYDATAENGVKVVKSYTCDYEYEFEIPALGHMWQITADEDGTFYFVCEEEGYKGDASTTDEFGVARKGCGATDKIEVRAPIYNIAIEGKVGTLVKADDNMSDLSKAYVRIVYDFETKDGVSTSLIFMAEVDMETLTFKVPVIKTGMTMTGASYIVVTDAEADELRYSQITNKYGELNI